MSPPSTSTSTSIQCGIQLRIWFEIFCTSCKIYAWPWLFTVQSIYMWAWKYCITLNLQHCYANANTVIFCRLHNTFFPLFSFICWEWICAHILHWRILLWRTPHNKKDDSIDICIQPQWLHVYNKLPSAQQHLVVQEGNGVVSFITSHELNTFYKCYMAASKFSI